MHSLSHTPLYCLEIKKKKASYIRKGGKERCITAKSGKSLTRGRAPYLAHGRLPFKRGHGSSHHPLHGTRLGNGEILQKEGRPSSCCGHLRSRRLPAPKPGAPPTSSLLCFPGSYPTQTKPRASSVSRCQFKPKSPALDLMTPRRKKWQVLINTE